MPFSLLQTWKFHQEAAAPVQSLASRQSDFGQTRTKAQPCTYRKSNLSAITDAVRLADTSGIDAGRRAPIIFHFCCPTVARGRRTFGCNGQGVGLASGDISYTAPFMLAQLRRISPESLLSARSRP